MVDLTPEEQLLMRVISVGWESEQAQTTIVRLLPVISWPDFRGLAARHRLLILAVARVNELSSTAIPHKIVLEANALRERVRNRAAVAEMVLADLSRRGRRAQIRIAPVKGPVLAGRIYGDSSLRDFSDIDVLVKVNDLAVAADIAGQMGYVKSKELIDRRGLPLLHLSFDHEWLPRLEIHWRLHWYESRFAADALDRSEMANEWWQFAPEDEFIAMLLFFARDGLQGPRWGADVAAWWESVGRTLEPNRIRARLAEYPRLEPAARSSAAALNRGFGLDLPCALSAPRQSGARERLSTYYAAPLPRGDFSEMQARAAMVDVLLAPTRQLGATILRRLIAPSVTFERRAPTVAELIAGAPVVRRRVKTQAVLLLRAWVSEAMNRLARSPDQG